MWRERAFEQSRSLRILASVLWLQSAVAFVVSPGRWHTSQRPSRGPLRISSASSPWVEEVPGIRGRQVSEVTTGTVLVAKPWEYNHFTSKQCLFVFHHNREEGSRAVLLEKATAFTLGELSPSRFASSLFANHTVFLGGERGGDMAILLHPYEDLPGAKPVGGGIFYGGLAAAEAVLGEQQEDGFQSYHVEPLHIKWFFNYMGYAPGELEKQVADGCWDMMELSPNAILRQGPDLAERALWPLLRRLYLPKEEEEKAEEEKGS